MIYTGHCLDLISLLREDFTGITIPTHTHTVSVLSNFLLRVAGSQEVLATSLQPRQLSQQAVIALRELVQPPLHTASS